MTQAPGDRNWQLIDPNRLVLNNQSHKQKFSALTLVILLMASYSFPLAFQVSLVKALVVATLALLSLVL
jgi:hypothetical protein